MEKIINFKDSRWSWSLLALIPISLIVYALYVQHILGIEPCALCIHQRIGFLGVMFAGLLVSIFGFKNKVIRAFSYLLWIGSASYGLYFGALQWYEAVQSAKNPFFMAQCAMGLETIFPWLENHAWLKGMFIAGADCSDINYTIFTLEMHHWVTLFFSCFLITGLFYGSAALIQTIKRK